MRRVIVDPDAPQRDAVEEAAKWIRNGGLVAVPTDTLYGLAADPFRRDAVARVFAVKGRAAGRALPLIAADADQVAARLAPLSPAAERLAARFWPGPLTLLIPAPVSLVREVTAGARSSASAFLTTTSRGRSAAPRIVRSRRPAPTAAGNRRQPILTRSNARSEKLSIC
jgi:L-threonylcarbamoyladenylate synthase